MFLAAIVGAVAIGLGIAPTSLSTPTSPRISSRTPGFDAPICWFARIYGPDPARDALGRRIADQIPLLILFFAAPFERTYIRRRGAAMA